uniref:Uncharacterized protein n=1 Tax=Ditylenchus dipsaci TaxID=166011 RepID=A0A915D2X8_9BILA
MFELCKEIDTNVFYIMNLNKGIVNMIIFLITQKIYGQESLEIYKAQNHGKFSIQDSNWETEHKDRCFYNPQLVTSIYVADKRLSISPPSNLAEKRLSILSNTPLLISFEQFML